MDSKSMTICNGGCEEGSKDIFFLQQPYFEEGEGTGHLLATIMKTLGPTAHILEMQSSQDICHPRSFGGILQILSGSIQKQFSLLRRRLY